MLIPKEAPDKMHGIALYDEKGVCRCIVADPADVPAFEQVSLGELDERIIVREFMPDIQYLIVDKEEDEKGFKWTKVICRIRKPAINGRKCYDIETNTAYASDPDFPLYIQALLHAHWRAKQLQREFDKQKGADSEKANQS